MSLKLYTNKESRGVVIDWLLVELGVECERIEVAYKTEMKSPEYLKLNPFGKVPVLVDGDVVIYELGAICAYLADKFSEKGLAPALDDPKRGLYYRWLFVMAGPWEAAGVDKALGIEVSPEQKMFVGYGDYNDAYQALVQGLSEANPYVCGEQFTAADVSVGAMLLWQLKMGAIESHPAITRYVETIKQREGLKQSTMGQLL
ncbi:glutathione S-transferase family protein [Acinetobacter pittii]|uniref:glutathione S-transferase family protein n=1 Tax=Acinetobacter pittii TaxID=48296 RepID=UPI001EE55691|nr:glutathione S-transferase family protein [Acinetobacter pittii]MCG5226381.1 glutathione S-transferase family protein [Acinetobacter pittii]